MTHHPAPLTMKQIKRLTFTRPNWNRTMNHAHASSGNLEVIRKDVPLVGLPRKAEGLKIGIMSDFHAKASDKTEDILKSIATMKAEAPDLIALTGDYIDAWSRPSRKDLEKSAYAFETLQQVQPPLGIYAVLGNHDHWVGADFVKKNYQDFQSPSSKIGVPS